MSTQGQTDHFAQGWESSLWHELLTQEAFQKVHSVDTDLSDSQKPIGPTEGWNPIWEQATGLLRYWDPCPNVGNSRYQVTHLAREQSPFSASLSLPPNYVQPYYF